jgi:hypothetical protein
VHMAAFRQQQKRVSGEPRSIVPRPAILLFVEAKKVAVAN